MKGGTIPDGQANGKQGRIAVTVGTWDGSDIRVAFDDLLIIGPEPFNVDTIDSDVTE